MPPSKPDISNTSATGKISQLNRKKDSGAGGLPSGDAEKTGRKKTGRKKTKVFARREPMLAKDRSRVVKASVDSAGRILIPAKLRRALDIKPGDNVNLELKGSVLEVRSLHDTINAAQALVRKYVPKQASLVEELIAERRADAERE